MMSPENEHMNRLYVMLEKTKNEDNAATLRWAIFTLEQLREMVRYEPGIFQSGRICERPH